MKNAYPIYSKTRLGIDIRVWFTFIICFFIAAIVFGFKLATHVSCSPFEIILQGVQAEKSNSFYSGETITFITSNEESQKVSWDFGDRTPPQQGNKIKHSYLHDGNYTITATVNGTCLQTAIVNISQFTYKKDVVQVIQNPIIGIDTPFVGDVVEYRSSVKANSYEWSILNTPQFPSQSGDKASYNFPLPGNKILELKLDGDDNKVYRKIIQVLPKKVSTRPATTERVKPQDVYIPPPAVKIPPKILSFAPLSGGKGTVLTISGQYFTGATAVTIGGIPAASFTVVSPTTITATVGSGGSGVITVTTKDGTNAITFFTFISEAVAPPKPKILIIPDEEFKAMFDQVCNGTKDASAFNPYLCDGDKTKVLANNEWKTVASFCELLKERRKRLLGHKNYSIKSVKVTRDPANQNCVTILTVEYN